MMPARRVCLVLVACACAVVGLAGCSSRPVCFCAAAPRPAHALYVTTAGRVRWQLPLARAGGSGNLSPLEISVRHTLTGRTRWTAELNEPLAADSWQASPALPVFLAGRLLIVPAASPDGGPEMLTAFRMSDGHRAWHVTIPGPVEAPLSAAPRGMLVYAGG